MKGSLQNKEYICIKTFAEHYDFEEHTVRDWCRRDLLHRLNGEPEKGMFHGRVKKVGRTWRIPVSEIKRIFGEDDAKGTRRKKVVGL